MNKKYSNFKIRAFYKKAGGRAGKCEGCDVGNTAHDISISSASKQKATFP
jgi:hypothetical protein